MSAWLEAPDAGAPSDPLNEAAASEAVASSSQSCTDGALARRAARRRGLARRGRPPGLRAAAAGLSGDSGSAARSAGDSSEKKLPALLLRRREHQRCVSCPGTGDARLGARHYRQPQSSHQLQLAESAGEPEEQAL